MYFKVISLFCALTAFVNAGDVVQLTDANFQSTLNGVEVALVKFYAPWCGHCKKLAPEFETAATALLKNDPPVTLAEIDCTAETTECGKYGVSGYPTLKIFKAGEKTDDYNGPRDSDGIVKYMRSKAGPASKLLETAATVATFVAHEDHSIVGFFSGSDSAKAKSFQKLASALSEDFRFAHTEKSDLGKPYDAEDTFVIFKPTRLHTKMEASQLKYDSIDDTLFTMKKWLNENIHGLAGHRTQSNTNQFESPLVTVYYDVDYVKNIKGTNYWRNRVIKVAKKLSETHKVHFCVANAEEFGHEMGDLGLSAPKTAPVVAAKNAKNEKFVMTDDFSVDNLEKFVNDFMAGKIEVYLKSEPIPEDNSEPVKVVVAKTFDDIVNDPTKDVLIEFYAPWCGHCKNLIPIYEEVAKKLADESDIVIAKMDATANDVPSQYQVQGFPTIYYAPKGSKQSPKKYEGGREAKDFIKYLAKESTDPLKKYGRDGRKKKVEL